MAHLDSPHDLPQRLGHLPAAQLRVLIECFYRGRTVDEAADRLDLPVAVVKQQLRLAARALASTHARRTVDARPATEPRRSVTGPESGRPPR